MVLTEVDCRAHSEDREFSAYVDMLVVRCGGCEEVSFCKRYSDTESNGEFTLTFHPPRLDGRPRIASANLLPSLVERIYRETHEAICNGQSVLAGIGIRAIVEAVCTDRQIPGKALQDQIDGLVTGGLTTPEGSRILHSIRYLGNDAAHRVAAHTSDELRAAFSVVEHLLESVYVIPELARKLPAREP